MPTYWRHTQRMSEPGFTMKVTMIGTGYVGARYRNLFRRKRQRRYLSGRRPEES